MTYREQIRNLLDSSSLPIDLDIQVGGPPPTLASSQFLTNREQGLWAEDVALRAINEHAREYSALHYGQSDSISAGDPAFAQHYAAYRDERNSIGKQPDILICRRREAPEDSGERADPEVVSRSVGSM